MLAKLCPLVTGKMGAPNIAPCGDCHSIAAMMANTTCRAAGYRADHPDRSSQAPKTMQEFVQFDKGRPFYGMVANFMVAMSAAPAIFSPGNPMNFSRGRCVAISGVQVEGKHLYPIEVYEQAQAGHTSLPIFIGYTCMMVANLAYECVRLKNDHSPEFEFFRHVRNASSHGNRFTFTETEPRRPAAWRGAVLDHARKGSANPLHGQLCFGPVLGPADLVQLLADVEARIGATA